MFHKERLSETLLGMVLSTNIMPRGGECFAVQRKHPDLYLFDS